MGPESNCWKVILQLAAGAKLLWMTLREQESGYTPERPFSRYTLCSTQGVCLQMHFLSSRIRFLKKKMSDLALIYVCLCVAGAEEDSEADLEERGDLIQFYNSVYVLRMKGFAVKYAAPSADSRVGYHRAFLSVLNLPLHFHY